MRIVATIDNDGHYVEQSLVCIIPHGILTDPSKANVLSLEAVLGFLNSTLNSFFFASYVIDHSLGGGLIHATPGAQEKLLLPAERGKAIKNVEDAAKRMLELSQRLSTTKTVHDRELIEREIERTDLEIDRLVYELYGLTEAEIKIVEEVTKQRDGVRSGKKVKGD